MDSRRMGKEKSLRGALPIFLLMFGLFLFLPASARADKKSLQTNDRLEQPKANAEGGVSRRPRFSLRLSGGAAFIAAKEFNDQLSTNIPQYSEYDSTYCSVIGEYHPLHWSPHYGAEIILDLTPRLGFGLGIGFPSMARENTFNISTFTHDMHHTDYSYTIVCNPSVKAVPITLGMHFGLLDRNRIHLEALAGIGLYRGTMGLDFSSTVTPIAPALEETWTGRSWNVGLQGGFSLSFRISPEFSTFVEVIGRYAQLSNLRGTAVVNGSVISDATLWLGTYTHVISDKFQVTCSQAVVDLSGFSIQAGIEIGLGRR